MSGIKNSRRFADVPLSLAPISGIPSRLNEFNNEVPYTEYIMRSQLLFGASPLTSTGIMSGTPAVNVTTTALPFDESDSMICTNEPPFAVGVGVKVSLKAVLIALMAMLVRS